METWDNDEDFIVEQKRKESFIFCCCHLKLSSKKMWEECFETNFNRKIIRASMYKIPNSCCSIFFIMIWIFEFFLEIFLLSNSKISQCSHHDFYIVSVFQFCFKKWARAWYLLSTTLYICLFFECFEGIFLKKHL